MTLNPATLILSTGETFKGFAPSWQKDHYFGEVVFNTGMTGYVETLTDPSYRGQILTFTFPLIGNYGVPSPDTWESPHIHARGVILQTAYDTPEHHDTQQDFLTWLKKEKIPCLLGVDTRALTKSLREHGVTLGAIVCDEEKPKKFEDINARHLVSEVSVKKPITYGQGSKKIIAVDCGIKENILRHLVNLPITVKRVPYDYDYTGEEYDGLFISNGPGDPDICQETITILKKAMQKRDTPIFGICLGTQLMAHAVGAKTYKLPYGHRGQNQPCVDTKTKRAYLTSQNHGYAIDEKTLPADWLVSFIHLNDNTVAGIEHTKNPWFSVQFHPEAAPGPHDAVVLFKKFYEYL